MFRFHKALDVISKCLQNPGRLAHLDDKSAFPVSFVISKLVEQVHTYLRQSILTQNPPSTLSQALSARLSSSPHPPQTSLRPSL